MKTQLKNIFIISLFIFFALGVARAEDDAFREGLKAQVENLQSELQQMNEEDSSQGQNQSVAQTDEYEIFLQQIRIRVRPFAQLNAGIAKLKLLPTVEFYIERP